MRTGGSPVGVSTIPTVTTLTLLSRRKATRFRIILWRCWAIAEHGIARPQTRDPQLGRVRKILKCAPDNVRCPGQSREHILPASFTARGTYRLCRPVFTWDRILSYVQPVLPVYGYS